MICCFFAQYPRLCAGGPACSDFLASVQTVAGFGLRAECFLCRLPSLSMFAALAGASSFAVFTLNTVYIYIHIIDIQIQTSAHIHVYVFVLFFSLVRSLGCYPSSARSSGLQDHAS